MTENRRELSSRKVNIFHLLTQKLVKLCLRPNQISISSAFFALAAGLSLAQAGRHDLTENIIFIFIGLAGIQLRLLCNLIDGLMAVEGGLKTLTGELYNDVPDRLSDIFILVGAGYSAAILNSRLIELGWLAAALALLTAYIRVLGASMRTKHYFIGPMAKQHRMFVINIALIGSLIECFFSTWGHCLAIALVLITSGAIVTCIRRLNFISSEINQRP